jgi:hypothetical protein
MERLEIWLISVFRDCVLSHLPHIVCQRIIDYRGSNSSPSCKRISRWKSSITWKPTAIVCCASLFIRRLTAVTLEPSLSEAVSGSYNHPWVQFLKESESGIHTRINHLFKLTDCNDSGVLIGSQFEQVVVARNQIISFPF